MVTLELGFVDGVLLGWFGGIMVCAVACIILLTYNGFYR